MDKQKITIPLSEGDIDELREGGTFDWCFPTDKGENIDIRIGMGTSCQKCGEETLIEDLDDDWVCNECNK